MPSRFTPSPNNISGLTEISGNLYVSGSVSASSYIGAGGSGETNTASNVGSGTGLFKQKSGVDLEFKTLEGSGVTINSYDSVIGLTASGGGSTNPGGSDTQVQFNQNGSFAGDSGLSYDGSGSLSFGSATSDTHQVTGTLTISGSQPLKVFAPQGGGGGASIIARHTSSIGDWETPVSGALVVSADVWTAGEQNTGAVMYVHSQDEAAIIGFKNSSTLVSGEQKNAVTTTPAKGASIGLVSDNIFLRNHIGDVILRVDGAATNEIVVSGEGTRIGNSVSDVHQVTGTLTVSGNVSASNIVPHDDLTYDLGSTSLQWNKIYANELIGNLEGAVRFNAVNDEGAAISKGQVVYISGISGQTPTVALAACDVASKMPAFGLAGANAAQGAEVQIVSFGSLQNLNLTTLYGKSFSVGDTVFVETGSNGTSGSLTNVAPTGSNNLLQNMGRIIRNGGGSDGHIKVGGAGRTNATPNLDEGYLFVGNGSDQSVQDNTIYVSSSVNRVGINNTTPDHTLTVGGNVKYGTAASDLHQVTGTLAVSGTQPLTIYGPESTDSQASIISTHGTSIPWESPISGGLVVSADNGTGGLGGNGTAVLYVHSKGNYSRLGFKNSNTLVGGEQKNNVTSTSVKGVFVGLRDTELEVRNEIGDVSIRADASNEVLVSNDGTKIGSAASDFHKISGSLNISGSQVGLLHVLGDVTASNNVSASAFHGSYVSASTSIQSDLFKNGYYSASINSNTNVPTDQYNFFNYTVGATLSLTASNPVAGASYVFILRQDNAGGRVITFDSDTFKFPSGSAPSMSTGSHEVDILSGISDGVYIYADAAKKFS